MIFIYDIMQPLVLLPIFYNGSEEEGRANFKSFFDISKLFFFFVFWHISNRKPSSIEHIADSTKEIPYEELNAPQVCDSFNNISDY